MLLKSIVLICALCVTSLQAAVLFEWMPTKAHITGQTLNHKTAKGTLEKPARFDSDGHLIFEDGQQILIEEKFAQMIPATGFTVEAIVRVDQPTKWGGIIGYSQDNGSYEKGWILGYNGSNYSFKASPGPSLKAAMHNKPFAPGQWVHLFGVYNGKQLKLFTDGTLSQATDFDTPIAMANIPTPFAIGTYRDKDENYPMVGRIKVIRIHDVALSDADITKSANADKYQFEVRPAVSFTAPGEAVISWEATEQGQGAIAYGITRDFEHIKKSDSKSSSHTITLTDLEPNTVYYYRLAALIDGKRKMGPVYELHTAMNITQPRAPEHAAWTPDASTKAAASKAIEQAKQKTGFCLVYGLNDGKLAYEIARQGSFTVLIVDDQPERISHVRQALYKTEVYGTRISIQQVDDLKATPLTANMANLIVSENGFSTGSVDEAKRLLRPNGVLVNDTNYTKPDYKDSGDWGHQYGNAANTSNVGEALGGITSTDELQLQWIGKPGGDFGIDRNPRMPAPLATNGRLFHQGHDRMIALDSFNGHLLWSLEIPDLRRVNIPHDCSNWCADEDRLYVAIRDRAWIMDAATGKRLQTLKLTSQKRGTHDWGFIGNHDNYLIGSSVKNGGQYTAFWGGAKWYDKSGDRNSISQVVSDNIFAYDKNDGKGLWAYGKGVIINASITLADGKAYFLENHLDDLKRDSDGRIADNRLWTEKLNAVCLDLKTGQPIWNKPFPKLKYVSDTKGFVQVGYGLYAGGQYVPVLSQAIHGTKGGRYTYHSFSGTDGNLNWESETAWSHNHHGAHMQHPVVVRDRIYCEPTGVLIADGTPLDHKYGPREGCSAAVGTKDTLFFRGISRCMTAWGVDEKKPTHWPRLRPSCWLNFLPSNSMFLMPEGGAGCSCGGWMETSMGFIPVNLK